MIAAWYSLRDTVQAKDLVHNERRQKIAADPEFRAARAKEWFSLVFNEEEDRIFGGFADFPEFGMSVNYNKTLCMIFLLLT